MSQKKPQNLRVLQEEYKETVVGLCISCGKPVKGGWYGSYGDAGVCNKTCMEAHEKEEKYPGHTEADFLTRFKL